MDKKQAYDEIKAYISNHGKAYSEWYAGIASDPRVRLFEDHNVSEANGIWIYRQFNSSTDARTVEDWLLKLGCTGGSSGGDQSTVYAYAYLKSLTKP